MKNTSCYCQAKLTWNNFKKVATRLVLTDRQLIDLTALKRNTTLKEKREGEISKTNIEKRPSVRQTWGKIAATKPP